MRGVHLYLEGYAFLLGAVTLFPQLLILAPPFPEEGDIPQGSQDDVPVVRLAVETRDILVTSDRDLLADLNSCGVGERYGLQVLSPEEALERL